MPNFLYEFCLAWPVAYVHSLLITLSIQELSALLCKEKPKPMDHLQRTFSAFVKAENLQKLLQFHIWWKPGAAWCLKLPQLVLFWRMTLGLLCK